MIRVYLAAASADRTLARDTARQARSMGLEVTSWWHDEDPPTRCAACGVEARKGHWCLEMSGTYVTLCAIPDEALSAAQREVIARRNFAAIDRAEALIYLDTGRPSRGSLVEVGYALGRGLAVSHTSLSLDTRYCPTLMLDPVIRHGRIEDALAWVQRETRRPLHTGYSIEWPRW